MPRPVSWFRRFRGKVWHVSFTDDALATCGKARPADAEYVGERAPVNARVCGDCVSTALHLYALAQAGQMGDPRTPERGLIGVPGAPLPEVDDDGVVDAEIEECGPCGHPGHICRCDCVDQIPADVTVPVAPPKVDLAAALLASVEAARERRLASEAAAAVEPDEWPCGGCGHPNLDHDCDDGTCTVTNDDPGVSWGTCPCRGPKRAG